LALQWLDKRIERSASRTIGTWRRLHDVPAHAAECGSMPSRSPSVRRAALILEAIAENGPLRFSDVVIAMGSAAAAVRDETTALQIALGSMAR
jgi:hypothetical protein